MRALKRRGCWPLGPTCEIDISTAQSCGGDSDWPVVNSLVYNRSSQSLSRELSNVMESFHMICRPKRYLNRKLFYGIFFRHPIYWQQTIISINYDLTAVRFVRYVFRTTFRRLEGLIIRVTQKLIPCGDPPY